MGHNGSNGDAQASLALQQGQGRGFSIDPSLVSLPVTCCCSAGPAGAGQEPVSAVLPLALVNSLWRCIFNSFTEPI